MCVIWLRAANNVIVIRVWMYDAQIRLRFIDRNNFVLNMTLCGQIKDCFPNFPDLEDIKIVVAPYNCPISVVIHDSQQQRGNIRHWPLLRWRRVLMCGEFRRNDKCNLVGNVTQIAKLMGPTWGPPGSCRHQMGPMLFQGRYWSSVIPFWEISYNTIRNIASVPSTQPACQRKNATSNNQMAWSRQTPMITLVPMQVLVMK